MSMITESLGSRLDRRRLAWLGMAAVSGGLLAACGDDDDEVEDEVDEVVDEATGSPTGSEGN